MANRHRGEIEARLDGTSWRLCLTLGALAELEAAFGATDMLALAARFETGRLSALDCVRIIGAGLRGAGHEVSDADVADMQAEGGAAGFVAIVARLLSVTFGAAEASETVAHPASSNLAAAPPEVRPAPAPFPGTT
jgi:hypothetical protein